MRHCPQKKSILTPLPRKMANTLVLGLGNILCGDEGIGCRVVEYLYACRHFPDNVTLADGGVMGQELLGPVTEAKNLLIIDCGDFGLDPGKTMTRFKSDVPIWLGVAKMSPHQGSFSEILALAKLKSQLPRNIALLAIQPKSLDYGAPLSPLLRDNLEQYAQAALEVLLKWGITSQRRKKAVFLETAPTALQNYELNIVWPML